MTIPISSGRDSEKINRPQTHFPSPLLCMPAIIKARLSFFKVSLAGIIYYGVTTTGEIYSPNSHLLRESRKREASPHSFHSGESWNLSGEAAFAEGDQLEMFSFAENSRFRGNEIPAFARMEGLVELAAAFSFGQE